jgi:hypothetical protein
LKVAQYAILDDLPARLFNAAVTCSLGEVTSRARSLVTLRRALLDGRLPRAEDLPWPSQHVAAGIVEALRHAGVAGICNGNPDTTDDVLLALLEAVQSCSGDPNIDALSLELASDACRCPRIRIIDGRAVEETEACFASERDLVLDDETYARSATLAATLLTQVVAERVHDKLDATWGERVRTWQALAEVLEALDGRRGVGRIPAWLAKSLPLDAAVELRKWLGAAPPLKELLRMLGRTEADPEASDERVLEKRGRHVEREVTMPSPLNVRCHVDVRGVDRSGDWARMLPVEALLLRRPAFKRLWHARRIERGLATYDARRPDEAPEIRSVWFSVGAAVPHVRATRGPIIVLLDTSGSMAGARENVAKAIVAQTLTVATVDARPVYVYNFSGSGNLAEHELGLVGEGLTNALAFLTASFHGGTVLEEPLRRALTRCREEKWQNADILLVSDGEIGPEDWTAPIRSLLRDARGDLGLRLLTALVAPPNKTFRGPIVKLSDRIYEVPDWMAAYRTAD